MKTVEGNVYLAILAVWLVLVGFGAGAGRNIGGVKYFVMTSDSMAPIISRGAIVVARQKSSYQVGQIICFYTEIEGKEVIVAHRIAAIGGNTYVTAGDRNEAWDAVPVVPRLIIGKVELVIQNLGWLITLVTNRYSRWFTVAIPAALVIINELYKIKKELKNESTNRC